MLALFTSFVCDHCDGLTQEEYSRGFIVFIGDEMFDGRPVYVFRTRTDAALWRSANGLQHCPIEEVLSENELVWRETTGSLQGITLAERPFEIFPDHRFPPGPYRAFLARARERRAA
jgi:hypothetical protein